MTGGWVKRVTQMGKGSLIRAALLHFPGGPCLTGTVQVAFPQLIGLGKSASPESPTVVKSLVNVSLSSEDIPKSSCCGVAKPVDTELPAPVSKPLCSSRPCSPAALRKLFLHRRKVPAPVYSPK